MGCSLVAFLFLSRLSRSTLGRVKKGCTVGRRSDLLWVVSTTYGRSQ